MPEVTRSKARLGQLPGLVASPRDGEGKWPWKVAESRLGNAVVAGYEEVGSPSPTCAAANRSQSTSGFSIFKCKDKGRKYLTCPKYIT